MYKKIGYAKKEKHGQWKGDKAGYQSIHIWIRSNYGRANMCESLACNHKSVNFEWALIKGKTYIHNRKNFMMLCRSCHHKYDMNQEIIDKIKKHHGNQYHRKLKTSGLIKKGKYDTKLRAGSL